MAVLITLAAICLSAAGAAAGITGVVAVAIPPGGAKPHPDQTSRTGPWPARLSGLHMYSMNCSPDPRIT